MKTVLTTIVAILLICGTTISAPEKAETPASPKADAKPSSKIYQIYVEGMTGGSYALENIEYVDFHGVKCLKGRQIDVSWLKNKVVYIPTDKVISVVEFDSLEDLKACIQSFQQSQMK